MDPGQWNNTFSQIQRKGVLLNENILKENFQDVVNKAFDKEMGFGYISENGYKPRARVILQGKNPFLDNHMVSDDDMHSDSKYNDNVTGFTEPCARRVSSLQPGVSSGMGWGRHYLLYTQV